MRYEDRWAQCWPAVVDSVRHVELIALRNAWRAEALDRRFRERATLELHQSDREGRCRTCRQPTPCPTQTTLTTRTPWHRATEGQPLTLALSPKDVQAALAELLPDRAPADAPKPKLPPRPHS